MAIRNLQIFPLFLLVLLLYSCGPTAESKTEIEQVNSGQKVPSIQSVNKSTSDNGQISPEVQHQSAEESSDQPLSREEMMEAEGVSYEDVYDEMGNVILESGRCSTDDIELQQLQPQIDSACKWLFSEGMSKISSHQKHLTVIDTSSLVLSREILLIKVPLSENMYLFEGNPNLDAINMANLAPLYMVVRNFRSKLAQDLYSAGDNRYSLVKDLNVGVAIYREDSPNLVMFDAASSLNSDVLYYNSELDTITLVGKASPSGAWFNETSAADWNGQKNLTEAGKALVFLGASVE